MVDLDPDEERALIERAQADDAEALDRLLVHHLPGIRSWVRMRRSTRSRQRESTMDVVQSGLRIAVGDLERFAYRGPQSFRNWLLTYVENRMRNRARYDGAACRTPEREAYEALSKICGALGTPSEIAMTHESLADFDRAFALLTEEQQRVIVMARVDGMSHAEIAAELEISETASRKMLSRAQVRLAAALAGLGS